MRAFIATISIQNHLCMVCLINLYYGFIAPRCELVVSWLFFVVCMIKEGGSIFLLKVLDTSYFGTFPSYLKESLKFLCMST